MQPAWDALRQSDLITIVIAFAMDATRMGRTEAKQMVGAIDLFWLGMQPAWDALRQRVSGLMPAAPSQDATRMGRTEAKIAILNIDGEKPGCNSHGTH